MPCAVHVSRPGPRGSSMLDAGVGVLAGVEGERVRGVPVQVDLASPGREQAAGADVLREDHQLLAPRHPHEVLRADPDEADVGDDAAREGVAAARRARSPSAADAGSSPAGCRSSRGRRAACVRGPRASRRSMPCMSQRRRSSPLRARDRGPRSGWTGRGSWPRTSCSGSRRARSGRPSARSRPAFMTAMVSAMVMASSWSWVTWMNVMPTSVWIRLSSICICAAQLEVEGAERLVEQQHLGPVDQSPGPARPAAAGRRRAGPACAGPGRPARPARASRCTCALDVLAARDGAGRTRRSRRCRGAGRARSSGTRCSPAACTAWRR